MLNPNSLSSLKNKEVKYKENEPDLYSEVWSDLFRTTEFNNQLEFYTSVEPNFVKEHRHDNCMEIKDICLLPMIMNM